MGSSNSRTLSETSALPMAEAVTAFAFDIFNPVSDATTNVFLSPLSLFSALSMAAIGATTGKDSDKQLQWLLRHNLGDAKTREALQAKLTELASADKQVAMISANSVFLKEDVFKKEFVDEVTKTFDATTAPLTDEKPINQWVSDKTGGKIKQLVDSVGVQDRCYLMNAIYFKGAWTAPFDEKLTTKEVFKSTESEMPCNMMHADKKIPYHTDGKYCRMVVLPYGETQRFSAIILLPTKSGEKALNELIDYLNPEHFQQWLSHLSPKQVKLALPRFKVEYGPSDMLEPLNGLGLDSVSRGAMFLEMADNPDIVMSKLLHKAVLEVNEAGSEAAAATAAVMLERCLPTDPVDFVVDRPFVFAIVDNTNTMPLFLGKIVSPEFH